jgi:23S rRNA (cytidine1920-2'-O)/16S rRNA (cytidine1409-2'-O)-methyltransferase
MIERERIDRLLVARGLFESRAKAQAAIEAGRVTANEVPIRTASDQIPIDAVLSAEPAHPWVSRGGVKLAAALAHFGYDPTERICMDVGASTGGFTEVLLARGARRVYAVDVGRGQLHQRLQSDPRVVSLEGTDIRALAPGQLAELPDLAVVDASFISLKLVLPALATLVARPAHMIALIKPQFEAGPQLVKKGIVRDPQVQAAICDDVTALATSLGWTVAGIVSSPITGGDGNHEFFIGAHRV